MPLLSPTVVPNYYLTFMYVFLHSGFYRYFAGEACHSNTRLNGKTVVITGANTGIGKETAVDLARRNARVIMACRDEQRGREACNEVKRLSGNENVQFSKLDLADLQSVRKFAAQVLEQEPRIDILINNAGKCESL